MDASSLLKSLAQEIAADEAALEKKRVVAAFLRERIAHETSIKGEFNTSEPQHAKALYASESLLEGVTKVVSDMGNREFSVSDIYKVLLSRQMHFQSSTPKASIATSLARLVQNGQIRLTFKGAGKTPNRFQRVNISSSST